MHDAIELAKDLGLDVKPLSGGFDGERGGREVREAGRERDARTSLICLFLGELLFGHVAGDVRPAAVETAVERVLIDVVEKDVQSGAGADTRDNAAHGPADQDRSGP